VKTAISCIQQCGDRGNHEVRQPVEPAMAYHRPRGPRAQPTVDYQSVRLRESARPYRLQRVGEVLQEMGNRFHRYYTPITGPNSVRWLGSCPTRLLAQVTPPCSLQTAKAARRSCVRFSASGASGRPAALAPPPPPRRPTHGQLASRERPARPRVVGRAGSSWRRGHPRQRGRQR